MGANKQRTLVQTPGYANHHRLPLALKALVPLGACAGEGDLLRAAATSVADLRIGRTGSRLGRSEGHSNRAVSSWTDLAAAGISLGVIF